MSNITYNQMADLRAHEGVTSARTIWPGTAWGPIMAGAFTAVGIQFIFVVLGAATGLSSVHAGAVSNPSTAQNISIAAGAWWLISGVIALFAGGCVLGRLAGFARHGPLLLQALTMWSVVAVFGFLVVWSGLGIASTASSPLAAFAMRTNPVSQPISSAGTALTGATEQGMNQAAGTSSNLANTSSVEATNIDAEQARRAARTASWWGLVGLLVGIAASLGGAWTTAPDARAFAEPVH